MHHPKSDVDRLYIPRKEGGRGLLQLELIYIKQLLDFKKYLDTSNGWMLQLVNAHERTKNALHQQ